jgi:ketosteroid isomerase-like protein
MEGKEAGDRIRELLAFAGAMDVDGMARFLAPDIVMELPYAPPPFARRHDGLSAVLAFQRAAAALFSSFRFEVDRVLVVEGGRSVVAEYRSDGVVASSGRPYRNHYLTVFDLDAGGRVRRWREFYDPAVVQGAFPGERA